MTVPSETPRQVRRAGASAVAATAFFLLPVLAFSAPIKKEYRYTVGPGANLTVVNLDGPVTVRGVSGRQVLITATIHSNKVVVDSSQQGNRVEVWSHFTDETTPAERRVEYEISAPMNTNLTVRAASGPVRIERMRSDVFLEGDEAPIHVQDVSNGHVHVRTLNGAIVLVNVNGTDVEASPWYTVAAVARDAVMHGLLNDGVEPTVYFPFGGGRRSTSSDWATLQFRPGN